VDTLLTQIQESVPLKKLLQLILHIGNHLNGQSAKGGFYGFKLSSLNQLKLTKSVDGNLSLLEYIIQYSSTKFGKSFAQNLLEVDLDGVGSLASTESAIVLSELSKMKASLTKLQSAVQAFEKKLATAGTASSASTADPAGSIMDKNTQDRFGIVMSAFLKDAQARFTSLETLATSTGSHVEEVCTFFGEKPTTQWESLFARFADLTIAWTQGQQKLDRQQAAALKQSQTDAMKKQMQERSAAKAAGGGGGVAPTNAGTMPQPQAGAAQPFAPRFGLPPGVTATLPAGFGGKRQSKMGNLMGAIRKRQSILPKGGVAINLAQYPAASVSGGGAPSDLEAMLAQPTRRRVASKAGQHAQLNNMLKASLPGMGPGTAHPGPMLPVKKKIAPVIAAVAEDEDDIPPPPPPEDE
jgi:hypothetical protein